jgi:NAD(P)-dependent dehydrogenase (short-subunit alcohol dehydrogenase family)
VDHKSMVGKIAVVTGASKGIGRGIALGLAAAGAGVVVNYKTDDEGAEETLSQIQSAGGVASKLRADVGVSDEAGRLITDTVSRFGRIDLLVNNAGRTRFGPPEEVTDDDFDDVVNTNLRGALFTSIAAARSMRKTGGGAIVNISSCAASLMIADHAVYTMSKGGLEALTRQLALEFAPSVRVNAIAPAPTSNERNAQYDPDYDENWGRVIPLGRVAHADDFVGPVIFLATDASRFLTGEVLHVDGGWTLVGRTPSLDVYDYSADRTRG